MTNNKVLYLHIQYLKKELHYKTVMQFFLY